MNVLQPSPIATTADSTLQSSLTLRDLIARLRTVPEALVECVMPDPFALRLTAEDPGGPRTAGLWMVATCNDRPYAFPLYRFDEASRVWAPHVVDGRHVALFPEGQLPIWWNTGELIPGREEMPRDPLLVARWAPEIHVRRGLLTLHYTARDKAGILRSAYATATEIDGPWTDQGHLDLNPRAKALAPDYPGGIQGADPLLGTIDGHVTCFVDEAGVEHTFLLTKVDGNDLEWQDPVSGARRAAPTPVIAREFVQSADGKISFCGEPVMLSVNAPHHDGLIEGQFVIEDGGTQYLVYSAGCFGGSGYRTYVSRIEDLRNGKIAAERLLIDSDSRALGGEWVGPGHPSFVKVGEGLYEMYLHAWPRAGGIFTPVHNAEYREGRKVIHRYVSFRDARGNRCEPYVVDDSVVVEG